MPCEYSANILKIFLASQIQQYVKGKIHHSQIGLIPVKQGWFNIKKSIIEMYHINKLKKKSHNIISIDREKALNKIQHPLLI